VFELNGKYTSAKVMIDGIDPETMRQIQVMVNHPSATNPVAIMPDTHAGKGCVIGFTMKASDKVVPNFVGVDVGCGMLSVKTNLKEVSNDNLALIDKEIRRVIPMGMTVNTRHDRDLPARFLALLRRKASETSHPAGKRFSSANEDLIKEMIKKVGMETQRFWNSIGTLGGGNHFQEMGRDENGSLWLTVHTGSRNFGKRVCEYFDDKAQEKLKDNGLSNYAEQLKDKVKRKELNRTEIGRLLEEKRKENKLDFDVKDSAYVTGDLLQEYLEMMFLAQVYAEMNRKLIIERVITSFAKVLAVEVKEEEAIETVHNFISFEDGIIRKGAVQSYAGRKMVIPFNMRDGLLICDGKSNPEWNLSAPHGAGRVLSRRQAKDSVDIEVYRKSMEGIFSTSIGMDTLDESPMAYKDAAMIEEAIQPTASIIHRVKPIYNVKAGGE
jgi:tRNA-splicing ligase RtcB (3'-phosphate/5'-hydroxy nucleic acid ligase)